MFSKWIQRSILIVAVLVIVAGVYTFLAEDYISLPSENWSKDESLFTYNTDTGYADFFNKQLSYLVIDEELNIIYLDRDMVKYKIYSKSLEVIDEGTILTLNEKADSIYATSYEDGIEMVVKSGDVFSCYSLNTALKLKRTYDEVIDHPNYHVSNSHIMMTADDNLEVISSKGSVLLQTAFKPYNIMNEVRYNDGYTLYYISLIEQDRIILKDTFDEEGNLLSSKKITSLISDELRLRPIDFQVYTEGDIEAYKVNVKDFKSGESYLNYFKYDNSTDEVLYFENYKDLQDKTDLISTTEIIGLFNHEAVATYLGKSYYNFYNLMSYDLETHEMKPLSKTYKGPRDYTYLKGEPYNYLVWGELKRGEMSLKIASDDPDHIAKSQVFTRERIIDVLLLTVDAFMAIPTYIIITGVGVLAMVMLLIMPGYLMFVTFFERHKYYVFGIMVLLHNAAKIIIHVMFLSRFDDPLFSLPFTIGVFIATNALAFYNYSAVNHRKRFDNPITAYIPFFITDILLHTFVFGPYILMYL